MQKTFVLIAVKGLIIVFADARVRREAMEALHSITKGGQNK